MTRLALALLFAAGAAHAATVTHVGMVAPDVVGITITDGHIAYGTQQAYTPLKGDEIMVEHFPHRWLKRDGVFVGAIGGADKDILLPFDTVEGRGFDTDWADQPKHYTIASAGDPAYAEPRAPLMVHRKTKPSDMGRTGPWDFDASLLHVLYLRLPAPLTEGQSYTVRFQGEALPGQTFTCDSRGLRSEAVHVSQIGFRPDDPAKVGFLSCWLGDGGGLVYEDALPFLLLDDSTGETSFEGVLRLSKAAEDEDEDIHKRNYNGTDVYEADFSSFSKPGAYRMVVPGVGCSYPFPIAPEVWRDAFQVSTKGLYAMRSGIALGPPYSDYTRPRCFHPDDGVKVYASTTTLLETGNGPIGGDVEDNNFGNLVKGRTDEIVPNAWGGYMDAGDWDRRIQHLLSSQLLIELATEFPEFAQGIDLNIPESGNGLPDIIDEALFNIDFYRRLQTPEGGVRGGIESEEHPRTGETSWQESLTVLAYAPGRWSSYQYAGTAAAAAYWLEQHAPGHAAPYRESALRAVAWAEAEGERGGEALAVAGGLRWTRMVGGGFALLALLGGAWFVRRCWRRWGWIRRTLLATACTTGALVALLGTAFYLAVVAYSPDEAAANAIRDARNYAAAELFRLTGDPRWNEVFLATTGMTTPDALLFHYQRHDQEHGAWTYLRTEREGMNEAIKENCRLALLRTADERLATCENAGFRWTKFTWRFFGMGVPSAPGDATTLVRAHMLTGNEKYLRAAVLVCQAGAGANPTNMCFTTGLGVVSPQHPLHLDSRLTHQPAPPGLTVLGPRDMASPAFAADWGRKLLVPHVYPALETWPAMESYMDVFWNSPLCEFTIHIPMAPNAYVWGYLAARE